MDLEFGRIQFTPDLMPSDVTGIHYYNQKAGEFVFRKGPVFSNILLADEINRATPRTQSSLLEAMEERQVTIDGETMELPEPFFVIATENPVESAGTFPLPEAQLDRFLMKLESGLPEKEEERIILERFAGEVPDPLENLAPVCGREELFSLQAAARQVYVHPQLMDYTRTALRIYMGSMFLFGIQMACQMTFNALGKAKESIVVAVMRKFVLLIPLIYIMPQILRSDQTMAVYMAEPIADLLAVTFTAVLFSIQFKKTLGTMKRTVQKTAG